MVTPDEPLAAAATRAGGMGRMRTEDQVKRSGRGFRSFLNYRLRILLAGGRRPARDSPCHEHPYSPSQVGRVEPVL